MDVETKQDRMNEAGKTLFVIIGSLVGLIILGVLSAKFEPDDAWHFASRMTWALGFVFVGTIAFAGVYYLLDWQSKGSWGNAIMDGNIAAAIVQGCAYLAIGVLLLGAVGIVV